MESEIPRVYSPDEIETRWAREWVEGKLYRPSNDPACPNFCLVIAPPNITGSLHMGHMLEHTEVDTQMRWRRMSGRNVLWLPGTDHASIATQMIVEREIGREALSHLEPGPEAAREWQREGQRLRLEMGREKFLERCWKWKELNGGTIRRQMERLGASVDWTRERFTMDAEYSRSVVEAFVRLYRERLIYRAAYVVNWCPRCLTAVSDLEVVHEERQGKLCFVRYPRADGSGLIIVATTRPETMLGDTAVAVNPSDGRYSGLVGRTVRLPLLNYEIPIIADDFVDPAFGTGAVKVTPAHDPNDFAIAARHAPIAVRDVIDMEGRIKNAPRPYCGMDRYDARKAVLRDLAEQGLLEKTEDHTLSIGICQRCRTDIEYLPSVQWFMKMKPLADPALAAVRDGRIRVLPESGLKKYINWMENIHDWCISRQLWWGHRIPAWFCDNCNKQPGLHASPQGNWKQAGEIVAREAPETCPRCGSTSLRPETDVLDTWFSSALWPFATLGWPERTRDLERFYPNHLMILGEDIVFFWGARMIMMGLRLTGDVPFRELYIHGLVRDAERQKMSKTKGNVLDPLEITAKYGTDAVRFALAISATPGTDIAFSEDKVESYRAFANKIWNAGRFILMNIEKLPHTDQEELRGRVRILRGGPSGDGIAGMSSSLLDRWMFSRLAAVTGEMNESLGDFRFHEAAHAIYHLFWHDFCDWYLEWVKPEITRTSSWQEAPATWCNLLVVFEALLRLLHPFTPFVTEELWHRLPQAQADSSISLTSFRLIGGSVTDAVSVNEFDEIRSFVVAVRNAKSERGLERQRPSAQVGSGDRNMIALFRQHQKPILRLAGLEALNFVAGRLPAGRDLVPVNAALDLRLFHEAGVDGGAKRTHLEKEKARIEHSLAQFDRQLHNQDFLTRAPVAVVENARKRREELALHFEKVVKSLEELQ